MYINSYLYNLFFEDPYKRKENKYCKKYRNERFTSITEAASKCNADVECSGFFDKWVLWEGCLEPTGLRLCVGPLQESPSTCGSVLYQKVVV